MIIFFFYCGNLPRQNFLQKENEDLCSKMKTSFSLISHGLGWHLAYVQQSFKITSHILVGQAGISRKLLAFHLFCLHLWEARQHLCLQHTWQYRTASTVPGHGRWPSKSLSERNIQMLWKAQRATTGQWISVWVMGEGSNVHTRLKEVPDSFLGNMLQRFKSVTLKWPVNQESKGHEQFPPMWYNDLCTQTGPWNSSLLSPSKF